jgi:hypothetical protein
VLHRDLIRVDNPDHYRPLDEAAPPSEGTQTAVAVKKPAIEAAVDHNCPLHELSGPVGKRSLVPCDAEAVTATVS